MCTSPSQTVPAQGRWLNRVPNARVVPVAVGPVRQTVDFYAGESTNQGRSSTMARPGLSISGQVEMSPLSEILSHPECQQARLIKIDVEGGEQAILQEILEHHRAYHPDLKILVELSYDGRATEELFQAYLDAGFQAYKVENDYSWAAYLQPLEYRNPEPLCQMPQAQTDLLFTRGDPGLLLSSF